MVRDEIKKVIKDNHCSGGVCEYEGDCNECDGDFADAILALEVPVWCDFYGRKCINGYCAVSAKPETCSHKSSATVQELIGENK